MKCDLRFRESLALMSLSSLRSRNAAGLWGMILFALVSCTGQQLRVSNVVPASGDNALRHCSLQGVMAVGAGGAAILCAGDESWLARSRGARLSRRKLHPFASGAGFTQGFLREGKVETVRQFSRRIRHIAFDDRGVAKIRDWPAATGSLQAAAAGPKGRVLVLLRHGDGRCYLNDLRAPEREVGRVLAWSRSCNSGSVGIIPRGGRPLLWVTTDRGIELGSPEAVIDRVPIRWKEGSQLLTSATDRGRVSFVVRDDSGIRIYRKAASGRWLGVHLGGTSTVVQSSCAGDLTTFFERPADKRCDARGHRVEVAAMTSHGSSLWLVLGTHRYRRRIRQRVEGGGPAMRLRGDVVANQERVELILLEIAAGRSSARSWAIAASESKALDCLDPQRAHHTLDDLRAVRLTIAASVVHVAAQNSERLFHFAVDVGRRPAGDARVVLTRKGLDSPQEDGKQEDGTKDGKEDGTKDGTKDGKKDAIAKAPAEPEAQQKVARVSRCEEGLARCGRRCADLRSAATDCGSCGHRCLSGRCDRGRCAAICHRDSDCDPKAAKAGVGLRMVCITRDRQPQGIGVKGPPRRSCRPGHCRPDETCRALSRTVRACVPRKCRRTSDCRTPGARCLAVPGRRHRQCLPPGHCASNRMLLVPRAR